MHGTFQQPEKMGGVCSGSLPIKPESNRTRPPGVSAPEPVMGSLLMSLIHSSVHSFITHSAPTVSGALQKSCRGLSMFSHLQEFTGWGWRPLPLYTKWKHMGRIERACRGGMQFSDWSNDSDQWVLFVWVTSSWRTRPSLTLARSRSAF